MKKTILIYTLLSLTSLMYGQRVPYYITANHVINQTYTINAYSIFNCVQTSSLTYDLVISGLDSLGNAITTVTVIAKRTNETTLPYANSGSCTSFKLTQHTFTLKVDSLFATIWNNNQLRGIKIEYILPHLFTNVNNLTNPSDYYVYRTFSIKSNKNTLLPFHQSPKFALLPTPNLAYINNDNHLLHNLEDYSAIDSIRYAFTTAKFNTTTNYAYNSPYSKDFPLTPFCVPSTSVSCAVNLNMIPVRGTFLDKSNGLILYHLAGNESSIVTQLQEQFTQVGTKRIKTSEATLNYYVKSELLSNIKHSIITKKAVVNLKYGSKFKTIIYSKDGLAPGQTKLDITRISVLKAPSDIIVKDLKLNPSSPNDSIEIEWTPNDTTLKDKLTIIKLVSREQTLSGASIYNYLEIPIYVYSREHIITTKVFNDVNANRVKDLGEVYLDNIPFKLTESKGSPFFNSNKLKGEVFNYLANDTNELNLDIVSNLLYNQTTFPKISRPFNVNAIITKDIGIRYKTVIKGTFYYDLNNNCTYDIGIDSLAPLVTVKLKDDQTGISGKNGEFYIVQKFAKTTGFLELKNNFETNVCGLTSFSVIANQINNLGFIAISAKNDLRIFPMFKPEIKSGTDSFKVQLKIENLSKQNLNIWNSAAVTLHFRSNENIIFVNTNNQFTKIGDEWVLTLPNIKAYTSLLYNLVFTSLQPFSANAKIKLVAYVKLNPSLDFNNKNNITNIEFTNTTNLPLQSIINMGKINLANKDILPLATNFDLPNNIKTLVWKTSIGFSILQNLQIINSSFNFIACEENNLMVFYATNFDSINTSILNKPLLHFITEIETFDDRFKELSLPTRGGTLETNISNYNIASPIIQADSLSVTLQGVKKTCKTGNLNVTYNFYNSYVNEPLRAIFKNKTSGIEFVSPTKWTHPNFGKQHTINVELPVGLLELETYNIIVKSDSTLSNNYFAGNAIEIYPSPSKKYAYDKPIICKKESSFLAFLDKTYQYNIEEGGVNIGTYTFSNPAPLKGGLNLVVKVTDSVGCSSVFNELPQMYDSISPINLVVNPKNQICKNAILGLKITNYNNGFIVINNSIGKNEYAVSQNQLITYKPNAIGLHKVWAKVTSSNGCEYNQDSQTFVVLDLPVKPILNNVNNVLSINSSNLKYQWFFKNGNSTSSKDTFKNIIPKNDSSYFVRVTNSNGCSNYSDTLLFKFNSITKISNINMAKPNPFNTFIQLPNNYNKQNVKIFSSNGQLIAFEINSGRIITSNWPEGLYILKIMDNEKVYTQKLVKSDN